jgi:type II secretory pathway component GspD/PulD (secretin)
MAIGRSVPHPSRVAQQNTTIQLPTFNVTTVSTTVTVPDGGTALLGGIGRARESSVTRGVPMLSKVPGMNRLFTNRGIGREVGAMNMSVTPRIIILEEEELRQTGFSYDMLSQTSGSGAGGFSSPRGGAVAGSSDVVSDRRSGSERVELSF